MSRGRAAPTIGPSRALRAGAGRRLVLAVYSRADRAPQIARLRRQYCGYVAHLLAHAPEVTDVVIWNEPNSSTFWRPQFDADGRSAAAPAYERLLAQCWDDLHWVRPDVNVIAATAPRGNDDPAAARPSHSPVAFYRELGRVYRESGRDRPIFDTVGHNPYPNTSAEPPWPTHPGGTIGEGDYAKLVSVLTEAFGGTAQPVPGEGLSIWYMEDGFQTQVGPTWSAGYVGTETDPWALDPVVARSTQAGLRPRGVRDHATQLADGLRLAYCQPYVGAFFNFQRAVASVRQGRVDCAAYGLPAVAP